MISHPLSAVNLSLHVSLQSLLKEVNLINKVQSTLTTKYYLEVGDEKIAGKVMIIACLLVYWKTFVLIKELLLVFLVKG